MGNSHEVFHSSLAPGCCEPQMTRIHTDGERDEERAGEMFLSVSIHVHLWRGPVRGPFADRPAHPQSPAAERNASHSCVAETGRAAEVATPEVGAGAYHSRGRR